MASFSDATWLLIVGIGFIAILGMLSVLAAALRDQTQLIQLRIDVVRLQREYQQRLEEMQRPADSPSKGNPSPAATPPATADTPPAAKAA